MSKSQRNKIKNINKDIITLLKENKYVILYNKQNCYLIQNHSDLIKVNYK